jgi:hypothetical protein
LDAFVLTRHAILSDSEGSQTGRAAKHIKFFVIAQNDALFILLFLAVATGLNQFYIFAPQCSRSSTDRIMVSGTIDMSSNLVGSTLKLKPLVVSLKAFLLPF